MEARDLADAATALLAIVVIALVIMNVILRIMVRRAKRKVDAEIERIVKELDNSARRRAEQSRAYAKADERAWSSSFDARP